MKKIITLLASVLLLTITVQAQTVVRKNLNDKVLIIGAAQAEIVKDYAVAQYFASEKNTVAIMAGELKCPVWYALYSADGKLLYKGYMSGKVPGYFDRLDFGFELKDYSIAFSAVPIKSTPADLAKL